MDYNKALEYIWSVTSNSWDICREICFEKDKIVQSKIWGAKHKNDNIEYYPLDLNKIEKWSTMDSSEGIQLTFSLKDDKILCDASIYDCESFGGERMSLRWKAVFELPLTFITKISGSIERKLNRELDYEYESYLEFQKTLWIINHKLEILK